MSIAESLLPEFDHEMATTRSLLERVPAEDAEWKPHPKSYSMADLALHIATLPGLGAEIITKEETVIDPTKSIVPPFTTTEAMLELFDGAVAQLRAALENVSGEAMGEVWTFRAGDHVISALPRAASYRSIFLNHLVHHRGQLSVYLRLRDVPLPPIYGPTADS